MQGLFCTTTQEILFPRTDGDRRFSSDNSCFVDMIDGEFYFEGSDQCCVEIKIRNSVLLDMILKLDYALGNRNAHRYMQGYYGKLRAKDFSGKKFIKQLIVNYKDIEKYL